jgi:hypothetical protein
MYSSYVPGFSSYLENTLLGGEQGLPSEQPVEAEPYVEPIDLGGWNLANFQNQFMRGDPAQADAVNQFIAQQAAAGKDYVYDPLNNVQHQIAMNSAVPMGGPDYSSYDPNNPLASMAEIIRFNTGQQVGTPNAEGGWDYRNDAPIAYRPGQSYTLTDAAGKNVLGQAGSAEELRALVEAADAQKYGWGLYQNDANGEYAPGSQIFGESDPRVGGLMGALVNFGLPLALSFVPGLGWAGSAALMGAGSTAGGLMTGHTLSDALKSGAITAGTAGLLKGTGLDKVISNAVQGVPVVGDALRAVGNGFAPSAAQAIGDEIVVNGLTSGLGSGLAAPLVSNLASNAIVKGVQPKQPLTYDGNEIVAAGNRGSALVAPAVSGSLTGALSAAMPGATGNYGDQLWGDQQQPSQDGWDVVANRVAAPLPGAPVGSFEADFDATFPQDEIVVSKRNDPIVPTTLPPPLSVGDIMTMPPSTLGPNTSQITEPLTEQPVDNSKGGLGLVDYLQLASLGVGTLGSLFGGGGDKQGGGKWPGGAAPNPVFGSTLPSANLPGLTNGGGAPRTADELGGQGLRTNQDWYRYGYGPQQSFFKHVQQGAPNTSQAFTGYAEGGNVQGYVGGAGDGRSDQIDAKLSDGEYVIDAETVALLGNGSNKAGADLLDQFRVNVRKHKGRELSRGNFSEDAMRPEHYLAGGLA